MDDSNPLIRRFLDARQNGPARRAAQSRFLTGFDRSLSPRSLVDATANDRQAFLDGIPAEVTIRAAREGLVSEKCPPGEVSALA